MVIVVAACTTGLFGMLILGHLGTAAFFAILVVLALAGWHGAEPEEAG